MVLTALRGGLDGYERGRWLVASFDPLPQRLYLVERLIVHARQRRQLLIVSVQTRACDCSAHSCQSHWVRCAVLPHRSPSVPCLAPEHCGELATDATPRTRARGVALPTRTKSYLRITPFQ